MPDAPDPDYDPNSATIPLSGPRPTLSGSNVDLPLPEELAKLLPAGAYEVTGFLGAGGMGAVYKGMQIRLKRPVAIKIMRRDMGKDHDFEARFEREAQAMAKLNHPNIISVIDFGEAGPDYLFIVMELVDGTDLMDVIRSKQMTQEMALTLLPQICDALQFAHDHGIVHRDIKPSNIMLTRDGRVKMADFGLAKHFDHADSGFRTQTGTGMGTPDYAAPEQFDPTTPVDHRADIYALGVMIYQMITGALPRGVWRPPSQRAPVFTQWDAVVSRAMQNDPSERYQKASEVKTELSSIPLVVKDGSADTPVRPASNGGAAAKNQQADKSVRAPVKSRTPLLVGLIVGSIVLAIGAFFLLKKPVENQTPGSSASVSPSPNLPVSKSPIAAPGLPESGWKPLFTDAEWQAGVPGKSEFKDGLQHLRNFAMTKPQTLLDGAVRARIQIRDGTKLVAIYVRHDKTNLGSGYKLGTTSDGRAVSINAHRSISDFKELASYSLPRPLQAGDTLTLELRIQGHRLTGIVNGIAALEASDENITAPGEWGISAYDGSFESVEVQPLGAAAITAKSEPTEIKLWDAPDKLPRKEGVRWENGTVRLDKASINYDAQKSRDAILRASVLMSADNAGGASLGIRYNFGKAFYALAVLGGGGKNSSIELRVFPQGGKGDFQVLGSWPLPRVYQPDEWAHLEIRAVGDQITAAVDAHTLGTVKDSTITEAGGVVFGVVRTAYYRDIEYVPLDKQPAISPSPNRPVSKSFIAAPPLPDSGWKPLVSKAEWETDWDGAPVNWGGKLVQPNRRFNKEGLLHMQSSSIYKPSPSPDGAIQVESVVRQLPHVINLTVRADDQGRYAFGLTADAKSLLLRFIPKDQAKTEVLKECPLPTPLKLGDRLKLELRIQGSQITGLWKGVAVLQAQDQRLTAAGEWGLDVVDASIKSVEVQPLTAVSVSPSPNLPVSKSSDPKFPPGQWVKVFTKAEDLPEEYRNPDSGVKWEDGWIRGLKTGQVLPLPDSLKGNYAVRLSSIAATESDTGEGIIMRRQETTDQPKRGHYFGKLGGGKFLLQQMVGGQYKSLYSDTSPDVPTDGQEYTIEVGVVGKRFASRVNSTFATVEMEDRFKEGKAFIGLRTPFRDIEVINLDGLPEAEALRLLGVDEKGNDVRGKVGAAK